MPYSIDGIGFQKTDTSYLAAVGIAGKAGTLRDEVFRYIVGAPEPVQTYDIATALGRPYGSIQPRLSELQEDGWIKDSGKRGQTPYGRAAILWVPAAVQGELPFQTEAAV